MAIPKGYRRNSSGFVQPIGSASDRKFSGPGRGNVGMTMADFGRNTATKAADAKVLASFQKAQKAHEGVMAGIAKTETDTFKRINDALTASREVDAKNKDKLGNAMPPSTQTKYLESQLASHLLNKSQKASGLTPGGAGITPEQREGFKAGPGGPGGGRFDKGGSEYIPGMPGTSDLLQRGPVGPASIMPGSLEPGDDTTRVPLPGGKSLEAPPQAPEVFPMDTKATHKSGVEITLLGQQRMGQTGPEYLARTVDGVEDWVPRASFEVVEAAGDGAGQKGLEKFFAPKFQEDPDRYVI
jgi:hypothetical protein